MGVHRPHRSVFDGFWWLNQQSWPAETIHWTELIVAQQLNRMGTDGSQSIDGQLVGQLFHDIQINQNFSTFSTQLIPQVLSSNTFN